MSFEGGSGFRDEGKKILKLIRATEERSIYVRAGGSREREKEREGIARDSPLNRHLLHDDPG